MSDYGRLLKAEAERQQKTKGKAPATTQKPVKKRSDKKTQPRTQQSSHTRSHTPTSLDVQTPTHTSRQESRQPDVQTSIQTPSQTSKRLDSSTNRRTLYVTDENIKRLDKATEYLRERHKIRKADRSNVLGAILEDNNLWTEKRLDRLVNGVLEYLTAKLVSR